MQLTPEIALVGSGEARLSDRYDCNVYAVQTDDGPVLVDTGAGRDTEQIVARTRTSLGEPIAALLTHSHADHSQGGPDLQRQGIPVVAPTPAVSLLESGTDHELGVTAAKRDDVYPPDYEFTHYEPDRTVDPGSTIDIGGREFTAVQTRGHARDHVSYLTTIDGTTACFVGDAFTTDGSINLLNVPGSSLADYRADSNTLAEREIDALLPGHGLPRLRDGQECIDTAIDHLEGMFSPPSRT